MNDKSATSSALRVGIVGLQPGRSWAARAHVPALQALPDDFVIAGVANSTLVSAERAVAALGTGAKPFANVDALVTSPDIDLVSVTVRVPHHFELVKAALDAGKHVYCEWPLGNGLTEADALARLARQRKVSVAIGTQACFSPVVMHMKKLVADGHLGDVLSTTLTAFGGGWGGMIPDARNHAYLLDKRNGATMLTIPVGHALAALRAVLGDIEEVSSMLATRRTHARVSDSHELIPMSAPDQVLINGRFSSGAPMSMHYRGGMPRDTAGLLWEINGTAADLRVSAPFGHLQLLPLTLSSAQAGARGYEPLSVPADLLQALPADPIVGNVARAYASLAADIRHDTRVTPNFEDAVALHRIMDSIEKSDAEDRLVAVSS